MDHTARPTTRPKTRTIVVALLVGLAVLLLLFPASGIDPQPPVCHSMFGYVVSCDAWVAWATAAAMAGLAGLAMWVIDRRR